MIQFVVENEICWKNGKIPKCATKSFPELLRTETKTRTDAKKNRHEYPSQGRQACQPKTCTEGAAETRSFMYVPYFTPIQRRNPPTCTYVQYVRDVVKRRGDERTNECPAGNRRQTNYGNPQPPRQLQYILATRSWRRVLTFFDTHDIGQRMESLPCPITYVHESMCYL